MSEVTLAVLATPFLFALVLAVRDALAGRRAFFTLMRALYGETLMLHHEAARFARDLCASPPRGALTHAGRLSTPLVYPALAGEVARLRRTRLADLVEFHARLAAARSLVAAGDVEGDAFYPLLSHLVRAFNGIAPALWEIEDHFGWARFQPIEVGDAHVRLEEIERRLAEEDPDRVDPGYLWLILPKR